MSGVHPYIQALIDAGDVIVYFDPRSGSYRDWSGSGNDVTPTAPTRIGLFGANLNHTGYMKAPDSSSHDISGNGQGSVIAYFPEGYFYNPAGANYIVRGFNGTYGMSFLLSPTGIQLNNLSGVSGITTFPTGKKGIAYSWTGGGTGDFFVNGVFIGSGGVVLNTTTPGTTTFIIGTLLSPVRQIPSTFGTVLATNRALTATEQALVYDALEQTVWPRLTYSHAPPKGLAVCDDPGIVAAYNMRPVAGKIYDLSANRNDGTVRRAVYEKTPVGDALRFDGTNDVSQVSIPYDPSMNVTAGLSASCWARITELSGTLITRWHTTNDNLCWGMYIAGGVMRFAASGDGTVIDLDTANDGTLVNDGLLRHLAISYDVPTKTVSFFIDGEFSSSSVLAHSGPLYPSSEAQLWLADEQTGNLGDNYNGPMTAPIIRNYAATADEIKAEYNQGAETMLFKTDWGARETAAPVTAGLVGGSPWEVISGSFDVVTVDYKGEPHKALQCVSAGVCALPTSMFRVGPTQAARGGFRWVTRKGADNNFLDCAIISNQKLIGSVAGFTGYILRLNNSEQIELIEFNNGSFANLVHRTASGYIENGVWYILEVTRSFNGEFTTYLDGAPIDVSGGSGTNPGVNDNVNESEYVAFNMDAGDMILLSNRAGENGFQKLLGVPK
jgi:hypothetical protein